MALIQQGAENIL